MAHKNHEAMFSWDIIQWKITGNALFLCSETAVKLYHGCVFPFTDHLTWSILFISMLTVQEDAEPGAKSPVWNESLRQPSVRVHLQHLPRWALQHIFTYKYLQTHTHIEVLYHHRSHHIYMRQRLWGYPKHVLSSGETRSWCASLLLNQSDLVWRGETESPRSDCRERSRGRVVGRGSGAMRDCAIRFT